MAEAGFRSVGPASSAGTRAPLLARFVRSCRAPVACLDGGERIRHPRRSRPQPAERGVGRCGAGRARGMGFGTVADAAGHGYRRASGCRDCVAVAGLRHEPAPLSLCRRTLGRVAHRGWTGRVRTLSGRCAAGAAADGPREAFAPASSRSGRGGTAAAVDPRTVPVPPHHPGLYPAHADTRERHAVLGTDLRQADAVHTPKRVLAPRLAHVWRAPVGALALRLAGPRRAAVDRRRHVVRVPRLSRREIRARGAARALKGLCTPWTQTRTGPRWTTSLLPRF